MTAIATGFEGFELLARRRPKVRERSRAARAGRSRSATRTGASSRSPRTTSTCRRSCEDDSSAALE